MARTERVVIPGVPHHITQRGNNDEDIFFVEDDRRVYLGLLKDQCEKYGLAIQGYCLMTDHVHLIGTPREEDSLAKAVGRTSFLYTQYVNRLHKRSGHLWQNRFFSCPLDKEHFLAALRYVERNPVRAKLTRVPWTYAWSSAAAHVGGGDRTGLLDLRSWCATVEGMDWKEALRGPDDAGEMRRIRLRTHTGRPLASDSFMSKLERALGRRLRPLPVGRPRKVIPPAKRRKGEKAPRGK